MVAKLVAKGLNICGILKQLVRQRVELDQLGNPWIARGSIRAQQVVKAGSDKSPLFRWIANILQTEHAGASRHELVLAGTNKQQLPETTKQQGIARDAWDSSLRIHNPLVGGSNPSRPAINQPFANLRR